MVLLYRSRRAGGERDVAREDLRGHPARLHEARLGAASVSNALFV